MQPQRQLFAGHLGGDHAQRQVGDLVFGVKPRAFGQGFAQPVLQILGPVAALGGDQEGLGEGIRVIEGLRQIQQDLRLDAVDLVDRQGDGLIGHGPFTQRVQNGLHAIGQAAMRLDQQHDDIGIRGPAPGGGDHGTVQPAARAEQAGRVDEDDLCLAVHGNAPDARAGGLHLVRHDRNLGPDHAVQKGRFPGIGFTDQGHEARASGHEAHPLLSLRPYSILWASAICGAQAVLRLAGRPRARVNSPLPTIRAEPSSIMPSGRSPKIRAASDHRVHCAQSVFAATRIVDLGQNRPHRVQAGPAFVIGFHYRPRGRITMAARQRLANRIGVGIPL